MQTLIALVLCLVALPAAAIDGTEILKKVDRNLEPESYESYRQLTDIQPDGSKKVSVLYTMKKGRDKVVALFLAPASDKGRGDAASERQHVALHSGRRASRSGSRACSR